jgi:TonB-linked SusC/RagA family outer membrane protein
MIGTWRARVIGVLALGVAASVASAAGAQSGSIVPAVVQQSQVRNGTVLDRSINVHVERVTLEDALATVAASARIRLSYSPDALPVNKMVSLVATQITVSDAFAALLQDTNLRAIIATNGRVALVARGGPTAPAGPSQQQATATITGHVTDGALKTPLSEVSVRVEGTPLRTTANADGKYAITGVAPGTYRITARRVGYQPLTKEITIAGDQAATLDFALVAAPTRLDEVVTTAVGEQRRYQVGNTISTINADSIAPTAPITSLTDLISARAPGVTVLETSGMTGAGEAIRIRGLSSLVLQNDPILIVDGVREDNSAGGDIAAQFGGVVGGTALGAHPTPTRLNDIDFNDIETIDILKGPAASTEYGTDAANGVIVITTKHGAVGHPQWRLSAEQTESNIPVTFPTEYYSWGHSTDGAAASLPCVVPPAAFAPASQVAGTCVVDSVTRFNPLNDPQTSIFGSGNRGKYDLSVGGGSDAVRYFVTGGLSNETGVITFPPVFRHFADSLALTLPSASSNPNSEQQRSIRANTTIKLGSTADLSATASYLSTFQQTPETMQLYYGVFTAPPIDDAAHFYGYESLTAGGASAPWSPLSELGSQNTERVTGGLTGNWRPTGWFVGHATVGLDHGTQTEQELAYPLGNPDFEVYAPGLQLSGVTTDVYSVDLRGTATASITHSIRSQTSAGLQMVDTRIAGQSASTLNITSTNLTLNGATGATVNQIGTRAATLGGYGEEQVSFADRVFVTGALRIDAGSGFGGAYSVAAYPKASVSWLGLDRGPTTVRLRAAFGESGVQPTNGAALQLYSAAVQPIGPGGTLVSSDMVNWVGNPDLRPERSVEFEGGVDIGAWGNRVSLELTGYSKTTYDALVNDNLGATLSNLNYEENIGTVRNTGFEGSATVGIIQDRSVTWDVGVTASINHNTLVTLGKGIAPQSIYGFDMQFRQAAGYPLYGVWVPTVMYADANHDGRIAPDEVTTTDSVQFQGSSMPTREASLSTHLGLWKGSVTLSGLVDYRGGYKIANEVADYADEEGLNSAGLNNPRAPLWQQARAVANNMISFNSLDVEDGSFVRVREVALTYALPHSVTRTLRIQSASLTGAVRNLALWTKYSGPDPEVSNTFGINLQSAPTTGSYSVNNDIRIDHGAVPLARYWVVRLNLGL